MRRGIAVLSLVSHGLVSLVVPSRLHDPRRPHRHKGAASPTSVRSASSLVVMRGEGNLAVGWGRIAEKKTHPVIVVGGVVW